MEVWDGFVVVVSVILDIIILVEYSEEARDEIVLLTITLLWRVVRVTNSAIVCVTEIQRMQLRRMYKKKKELYRRMSMSNTRREVVRGHMDVLKTMGMGQKRYLEKTDSVLERKCKH